MKYSLLAIIFLLNINTYSQFGSQQIITTTADGSRIILATDIDGDGSIDVLSANKFGNNLTWYKNLDGTGTFGAENLIAIFNETSFIAAADIDGDLDIDVLAVSGPENKLVWHENLDGLGAFSVQKVLSNQMDGISSVITADIDNDGDNDIITASDILGLYWFENLDGQGDFSGRLINGSIDVVRSVVAVDMDGDGDLDVVGNGVSPNIIYWIENMDGLGTFGTKHSIHNEVPYKGVVYSADIDNDGDMDIISASPGNNEVAWYENLDGLGNFGQKNSITNTLEDAWTVYASDLDNDGDNDVLATNADPFGGEVVWFENLDGLGNFSAKNVISTEVQSPRSVIAADIDNDGDMDVIASSQNNDTIAWYENFTILGVAESDMATFKVYPNPTKGLLFIASKTETILSATVFDVLGKNVLQQIGHIQEFDISNLQNGMYFLRVATVSGVFVQKIIKE